MSTMDIVRDVFAFVGAITCGLLVAVLFAWVTFEWLSRTSRSRGQKNT